MSDVLFDTTIRYDASFFENLNRIVQDDTLELDRDRAMYSAQLTPLGIEKGKEAKDFNPPLVLACLSFGQSERSKPCRSWQENAIS